MKLFNREIPKRAVYFALALIAAAGAVTGREKPAVQIIEERAPRAAIAQTVEVDIDLDKLKRGETDGSQNDPFARNSFAPPAPQVADAPPPPPSAPQLPFRYFGKLTQAGKTEVYVMRGDDLISIAAGSKIDNEYRVERITDTAIAFTYLPMKTQQSLELGQVN
jgi:hypothetical protein